jgi:hypothetical protein
MLEGMFSCPDLTAVVLTPHSTDMSRAAADSRFGSVETCYVRISLKIHVMKIKVVAVPAVKILWSL